MPHLSSLQWGVPCKRSCQLVLYIFHKCWQRRILSCQAQIKQNPLLVFHKHNSDFADPLSQLGNLCPRDSQALKVNQVSNWIKKVLTLLRLALRIHISLPQHLINGGQQRTYNLYLQQPKMWLATVEDWGLPYLQTEYNTWIIRTHDRCLVNFVHHFTHQTNTIVVQLHLF